MESNNRIISEKDLNIVSEAIQKSLLEDFEYVSVDGDIDDGISIIVSVDDIIDLTENIDFEEIDNIMSSGVNARRFYRGLVTRLKIQHTKITELKNSFTTPEKLEEIEETDFLKGLERVLKDGLNNDNKYRATIIEGNRYRCKGKTTALAYYAMKYNIPIMVDIKSMEKIINRDFPEVETYYFNDVHNRLNFDSLVLVDEMRYDNVEKLVQQGVRVFGFVK